MKPHLRMPLFLLCLSVMTPCSTLATELDQYQLDGSEQNQALYDVRSVGQTFTVGFDGLLHSIEFSVYPVGPGAPLTVEILDMSGGIPYLAQVLGTVTIQAIDLGPAPLLLDADTVTGTLVNVTGFGIQVSAGDKLGFRLSSDRSLPDLYAIRTAAFSAPYPGGEYFVENSLVPEIDVAFKTFVEPAGVETLVISPPSGPYAETQVFDLTLLLYGTNAPVLSATAILDGTDVSGALAGCVVTGTMDLGGQTFRCPDVSRALTVPGIYNLDVTLNLEGGVTVTDRVRWRIVANTEP